MRTRWLDPDFRHEARADHRCIICGRALKAGQPFRMVLAVPDVWEALHPGDYDAAGPEYRPFAVGWDCAQRLGIEWTAEGDLPALSYALLPSNGGVGGRVLVKVTAKGKRFAYVQTLHTDPRQRMSWRETARGLWEFPTEEAARAEQQELERIGLEHLRTMRARND